MKFVCDRENFLDALQVVQRAVSLKNPLPILSGIKFEAEENKVFLTATDLEIGIRSSAPAEILEPGNAVLPARYITELIRRLPDIPIFIESDALTGSVAVKYGQSEASINGFPAGEFPDFPLPVSEFNFNIAADTLKEAIRQVVFAAATDENRPVFTGVLFEIQEGRLQVVATDTHRLAWRRIPLENCEDLDINLIIPGKTLNELVKIIGSPDSLVRITVTENQVLFNTGDTCLISRLIGGQFPNYRQVIPQEHITKVRLKTKDLADATERASLLTKEGSSVIKLHLNDNVLIITVNTEAGRVREELPVYQEGEPLQFAFNARYLSDILRVIGSEEIIMEFTGPLSPGIIKPAGDKEYLSLLLPVRLREE
jgi:DNA polymerase-3 subunit beta